MTATARKPRQRTRSQGVRNGGFGVNRILTPRTPVETPKYGQAVARMVAALSRRAEGGDLEALSELVILHRTVGDYLSVAARALNRVHGYSWSEVGRAAGISKQAANQRWAGGA